MRPLLFLLALAAAPLAAAQMNTGAGPAGGVLSPGADGTATRDVTLRAVAPVPQDLEADGCVGYVDPSAPDVVVEWGGGDLQVRVEGDFDATLVVARPDGTWACADDSSGSPLPVLDLERAAAGRYAVWVGSFSEDPTAARATVVAGPVPPRPVLEAGAPRSGTLDAPGGFEAGGGPLELEVQAGGPDPADSVDPDLYCAGFIDASRPTATVLYSAPGGTGRLAIGATAGTSDDVVDEDVTDDDVFFDDVVDLVLVVAGPDGALHCNDDYAGPDPLVVIDGPQSGTYAVWAGTFSRQDGTASATLTVAESADDLEFDDFGGFDDYGGFSSPYSEGTYVVLDLEAVPSVRLTGSADGPSSVGVRLTPSVPNPVVGDACLGYVDRSATVALELSGDGPFALRASNDGDLTLTVMTPGGAWFCSDDADGLDPGIQLDAAEDGVYRVWVGSYGDAGAAVDAAVSVGPGEVVRADGFGFGGVDRETQTAGTYDGTEIRAGDGAAEIEFNEGTSRASQGVMAGGPVLNPVAGAACQGFVSERPALSVFSDANTLEFEATSDDGEDLTMVVRAPDGAWTCSDDADGSDPAASVTGGQGEYSVWVGTFSRRARPSPATVSVSVATPPPPPPAPEVIRG